MITDPRLTPEPPLPEFTEHARKAKSIAWYRTPVSSAELKRCHERSDLFGASQVIGFLALLGLAGVMAVVWWEGGHPWLSLLCAFTYGTIAHFLINGVHELGHGTVFKTKVLNRFFCHVLAFLGWINHEQFQSSHVRHHRYTLHPPDDLENPLPIACYSVSDFLNACLFDWRSLAGAVRNTIRYSRGHFAGEWETTLFPANQPELGRPTIRWARILLLGHVLVAVAAIVLGHPSIAFVISLGPFFGGGLFGFCNNTQHVGLPSHNSDFRLCCRTFTLNPMLQFLYWHMNYHTEHHMYAAVPCYRLGRLHRLIRHDLPPTPHGLVAVWREIYGILRREAAEPGWHYTPPLPSPRQASS